MGLVLVVDDAQDTLYLLRKLLQRWGHETLTAETGEAGLALLVDHEPDLIIVDGMMPGMNGIEFVRLLRANEKTALVPAILYTALGDHVFTDNAIQKGANEVWVKGKVEYDQMNARVEHYLSR